jgi:hypothetical protein
MDAPRLFGSPGVSIFLLFSGLLYLSSCAGLENDQPQFLSPTAMVPTSVTTIALVTPPFLESPIPEQLPTQVEPCNDNLLFLEDTTIPDWTLLKPGSEVDKKWLVQNTGTCNWDQGYTLRLISGEGLSVEIEQKLFPARANSKAIIQVFFNAPMNPGTFHGVWQAYNSIGQPFGDQITILMVVES